MTEFELIYRFFNQQQDKLSLNALANPTIMKGLGDDAAVLEFHPSLASTKMVTCIDTLVQGRHFSNDWAQIDTLAFAIAYKAVAVNVSDVCAMGATPHSMLLALALPKRLANELWLSAFAKGLFHACNQFGVQLIGGDTTCHDKLVISVTANGIIGINSAPIYRSGARVGDKVYVSGCLGDASYALNHPDSAIGSALIHRLHMPTPRVRLAQKLAQHGVTAMIDVSDGLVQDLGHICEQSGVSMQLDLENLPSSNPLQKAKLTERLRCQLSGGDDYELAFTVPASLLIDSITKAIDTNITYIGDVVQTQASRAVSLFYKGNRVTTQTPYPFAKFPDLTGYTHFN